MQDLHVYSMTSKDQLSTFCDSILCDVTLICHYNKVYFITRSILNNNQEHEIHTHYITCNTLQVRSLQNWIELVKIIVSSNFFCKISSNSWNINDFLKYTLKMAFFWYKLFFFYKTNLTMTQRFYFKKNLGPESPRVGLHLMQKTAPE